MISTSRIRGAAVIETAIVISVAAIFVIGALQEFRTSVTSAFENLSFDETHRGGGGAVHHLCWDGSRPDEKGLCPEKLPPPPEVKDDKPV